jgi:probable rRNA maturation factor
VTRAIYRPPWRIDLDVRAGVASPVPATRLARAMATALDAASAPSPASIGLVLSDDRELAVLNATHMGKTGPTDVLSFPFLAPEVFAAREPRPGQALGEPRPPGSRVHLGEVIVSVERAIDQAARGAGGHTGNVRWSAAEELLLLVTHGTLHICGFDHVDPSEEVTMRILERRLLGMR